MAYTARLHDYSPESEHADYNPQSQFIPRHRCRPRGVHFDEGQKTARFGMPHIPSDTNTLQLFEKAVIAS
jgi:hypothetical protein